MMDQEQSEIITSVVTLKDKASPNSENLSFHLELFALIILLCIDYKALSHTVNKNSIPFPRLDTAVGALIEEVWVSKLHTY